MRLTRFIGLRVSLHADLARLLEDLAKANGESIESYIETLARDKTGFTGPKDPIYLGQTPSSDAD